MSKTPDGAALATSIQAYAQKRLEKNKSARTWHVLPVADWEAVRAFAAKQATPGKLPAAAPDANPRLLTATGPVEVWRGLSRQVRWVDGECGDTIDNAKAALRKEARTQGLLVKRWESSGADLDTDKGDKETPGISTVVVGKNEDGSLRMGQQRHMKATIYGLCVTAPPERWVRLTTDSGPAAVEVLETQGNTILARKQIHPEDLRVIAWGKAEGALQEMSG